MDPRGPFAPAIGVLVPVAIEHVAFAFRFVGAFYPHGFCDADGGRALLGVAEGDRFFRGQLDGEVDGTGSWGDGVEAERLFRREMDFSILLGDPFLRSVNCS